MYGGLVGLVEIPRREIPTLLSWAAGTEIEKRPKLAPSQPSTEQGVSKIHLLP